MVTKAALVTIQAWSHIKSSQQRECAKSGLCQSDSQLLVQRLFVSAQAIQEITNSAMQDGASDKEIYKLEAGADILAIAIGAL